MVQGSLGTTKELVLLISRKELTELWKILDGKTCSTKLSLLEMLVMDIHQMRYHKAPGPDGLQGFFIANYMNALNLKALLDKFCSWTVQRINVNKSTLLTSANLGRSFTKGIRGVIRDESGSFVVCYGKHIFKNNNNVAEVWAIRDGLRLAVHLGIHNFEVEGDSCYVVQLCKEEGQPQWDTYGLVKKISELMACFNQVNFTQRYREANNIVDRLAKDGASRKHEGTWIGVLPDFFVV
ncbi:uncharacterized protein LOC113349916 isoform X2 [Papaver somniferum]|uniref:uncharacterized protein LOC113349916 isoform X2 n=1 Tax=Papaver somniferum TaxID=3469 RepID=UPI000E6F988C|nr:uncharacterized protein LOC113349916 isoform X2 [Papaver somniferum]